MVTIPHQGFPHIIDSIWEHLDFGGLLVARAVCKDWAQRWASLSWHLSIEGKLDGRFQVRASSWSSSVVWDSVPTSALASRQLWGGLMSEILVLDLVGKMKEIEWLREMAECIPKHIPLVRWQDPSDPSGTRLCAPHTDTLVFFQDLNGPDAPCISTWAASSLPLEVVSTLRCTVDPLRQWVQYSLDTVDIRYGSGSEYTDTVTLILQDERPEPRQPPTVPQEASLEVIYPYLHAVRYGEPYVYIVGLEAFMPDVDDRLTLQEEFAQRFRDEEGRPGVFWLDSMGDFASYWKFRTHEEYRQEVGETLYDLYTTR